MSLNPFNPSNEKHVLDTAKNVLFASESFGDWPADSPGLWRGSAVPAPSIPTTGLFACGLTLLFWSISGCHLVKCLMRFSGC